MADPIPFRREPHVGRAKAVIELGAKRKDAKGRRSEEGIWLSQRTGLEAVATSVSEWRISDLRDSILDGLPRRRPKRASSQ
jgi:hypothetical protein